MIFLNGREIKPTIFPDKTSQVWKINTSIIREGANWIKWQFENEAEFFHVAQLADLVTEFSGNINLYLTYLPYARQDKPVSNENTFALHTFANLLNSLWFTKIVCDDPHSFVAQDLIKNFEPTYPVVEVLNFFTKTRSDILCFPDAGARNKYAPLFPEINHIHGEKVREQSTGQIVNYKLIGDAKDKTVLIVDDICDGGMTFVSLATHLRANGANEINLFVSHGIFSKGTQILRESGIRRIFTKQGEAI